MVGTDCLPNLEPTNLDTYIELVVFSSPACSHVSHHYVCPDISVSVRKCVSWHMYVHMGPSVSISMHSLQLCGFPFM